jgi:hypothetical protein
MPRFRKLVPMLQTKDMGQTVAWYETVLGFKRTSPHADGWCALSRDGVSIMFVTNAHLGPPYATATQYLRSMTSIRCGTELSSSVRPNGDLRTCRMGSGSSLSRTAMATF